MIESGEPAKTTEYEVGAGIRLSSKLVKGGGYAIKLPFIDVSEIGAGGGSMVSVDPSGGMGLARKAPARIRDLPATGRADGERHSRTAMVALGHLNPLSLAGGASRSISIAPAPSSRRDVAGPTACPARPRMARWRLRSPT